MPYTYAYPKADHTVDAVIFGLDLGNSQLRVLLIERGIEPYKGMWALPGGFIHMEETLEQAVARELKEETGVVVSYLEQLYTFAAPSRDPRGRVISTAYFGLAQPQQLQLEGGSDAKKASWWDLKALPELAFDHMDILLKALQRVRSKVRWQPIGVELLPRVFTLTDLQQVYETILDRPLDKRNFRRKVLSFGLLAMTGQSRGESHRPAKLYQFDQRRYRKLQKSGIDFEV